MSPLYIVVALSYRGYWTSAGRPSQKGIELDADAALDWIYREFQDGDCCPKIILWGQSIGAGCAAVLAARCKQKTSSNPYHKALKVNGLLLETPFLNLRRLLESIYPQKWLPYRYLWPFLRNNWDSKEALRAIASSKDSDKPKVLILQAGKDELVPSEHGLDLENVCHYHGFRVSRKEIPDAFHANIMTKQSGRRIIASFIRDTGNE